jgi:predicted Fe-Mo cluster-binding NifX family protein
MRIAVTSTSRDLDSNMDPSFGGAVYFIVVNPNTMEYEAVGNSLNIILPQIS